MKEERKHTKHTALIKPLGGEFHRNEWAIIGAPCDRIEALVNDLSAFLSKKYKIGYVDAAHSSAEYTEPFYTKYTDEISVQNFHSQKKAGQKQNRKFFNDCDLVFVNGNHFTASKQIVILNEKKKDSLSRKLDRLTDVQFLVQDGGEVYSFLKDKIRDGLESFMMNESELIARRIEKEMIQEVAPLYGLVLAGGKSQRMGTDKGALEYKQKPHREYTADLISGFCEKTYISCRETQRDAFKSAYPKLIDTFTGLGPYGAILSAFREHPNHACLSIACDLPYIDKESINQLIHKRNPSKLATCFHNPDTQFPEPLITIWEPKAYPVLLEFLSQGYSCPRKVLINTEVEEIKMDNPGAMFNANDKQSYAQAVKGIKNAEKS